MVKDELSEWVCGIIKKHSSQISKRVDGINALAEVLTGLKVSGEQIKSALQASNVPDVKISWSNESMRNFVDRLLEISKPILIVANKCDVAGSDKQISMLKSSVGEKNVVAISAAIELAIRKAEQHHIIEYIPESHTIKIIDANITKQQNDALQYMQSFIKSNGSDVQETVNRAVFGLLDNIVVYPVEDENKFTDHFGNVLPDAILMRTGSTALDLAATIHTDIAKNMLYAVDARSKRRLGKDYVLKNNDVIRIVSAAK